MKRQTEMSQKDNNILDRSQPGSPTTAPMPVVGGVGGKYTTRLLLKQNLAKKEITIGHWNSRSLYATGKLQELTHELENYSWAVIGLSEVRWTSIGQHTETSSHGLYFSGKYERHEAGVGFFVHRQHKG